VRIIVNCSTNKATNAHNNKEKYQPLTLRGTAMKKNLKILTPSIFTALSYLIFQVAHGMENSSKPAEQGIKQPPVSRVSSDSYTEYPQPKKKRYEEIRENPFTWCPEEITFMILKQAAIDNYLSDGNTGSLVVVCQDWRHIMKQDQMKKYIDSIKYQRFLKGILVYKPNQGSDVGRVDLPIAALENPLEDTFDLSHCGDMGKHLSISTGYRRGKKVENVNKIEIWLTPRFLVEKEINGSVQHYQEIFPSKWPENVPVGIFWVWGGWDNMKLYDYLTSGVNELSLSLRGACARICGPTHTFGEKSQHL